MSNTIDKMEAIMDLTNALKQQPEGLTEDTLWSQVHPHLTRPEFDALLARGIQIGALTKTGERYQI